MEKDKSRGIKHIKDKRKYKSNTTKNPKYVPPKSKPNLESNWDRYEITEENEHEHSLSSSTDFSLLSNVPISAGCHFQFKSDEIKESGREEDGLFTLNLDLLSKSILAIPFYERLDIAKENFKEHEIKQMDETAAKHFASYQAFVKSMDPQIITDKTLTSELPIIDTSNSDKVETVEVNESSIHCDKSENDILKLIESCSVDEDRKDLFTHKPSEELEQWLDDILED